MMKLYKTKLGKVINFIKNEGKFERSDLVEVTKNLSKYGIYDRYIGQKAIVTNINYSKKENIVGLKFLDGQTFDYRPCELKKCNYTEMYSDTYKKLLEMI